MKFLMTYAQSPNTPPPTPAKMAAIGALSRRTSSPGS